MARGIIVDLYGDGKLVGRMCVRGEVSAEAIADNWVEYAPYPEA